jgi:hypothetical protein
MLSQVLRGLEATTGVHFRIDVEKRKLIVEAPKDLQNHKQSSK